tara:strand:- start:716 stop:1588 length:873 start_codon:yes stop_codon:yes gene_type:complete
MFKGSMVALVTPFKNDNVDVERLRELVEFHIEAGTHGLVVAGTTGESGTLNHAEKLLVIKTVVEQSRERIPVIAGTAVNGTKACNELTKDAMQLGVDAALIMTPAYIKPTQQGLVEHYQAIARENALPIIMYNVPGRTACDLLPETVDILSHQSNIIGIKEATGDIKRLREILQKCGDRLDVYSGDDPTAADWMAEGAKGVISVTANVAPRLMAKMCDAFYDGAHEPGFEINEQLADLHAHLFLESNPIPTKWALSQMDLIKDGLRLPLTTFSASHQPTLTATLQSLKLI